MTFSASICLKIPCHSLEKGNLYKEIFHQVEKVLYERQGGKQKKRIKRREVKIKVGIVQSTTL